MGYHSGISRIFYGKFHSGCYMGYKSGDEDLCFRLDKDGNYRCKLMREIDSINSKLEDAMDKG
jgi:hypothetical protein